jgi:hypothetical protein
LQDLGEDLDFDGDRVNPKDVKQAKDTQKPEHAQKGELRQEGRVLEV